MKFSLLKKLFFCVSVVVFIAPFILHGSAKSRPARIKVEKNKKRMKLTLEKRTFYDPIEISESKSIRIMRLQLRPDMDLAQANEEVKDFSNNVATIGVNLDIIKETTKKNKEKIIKFLVSELPKLIDHKQTYQKTLLLGRLIPAPALVVLAKTNLKATASIREFMQSKYSLALLLGQRIDKALEVTQEVIDDIEQMLAKKS